MAGMVGSANKADVDDNVHAIVEKVTPKFKEEATKQGHNGLVEKLEAVEVMKQVVAGTNYFVKVKIHGGSQHAFLRIFVPLPHAGSEPELVACKLGMSESDALEYFE